MSDVLEVENKHTKEDLKEMQSWSLEQKIKSTQAKIIEWYLHYEGKVYISFSGGKDSTVLLDLARRAFPDIEGVFVDTGLEFPEIRQFVKTKENVTWLKPEMRFDEVIEKYGYPVISKEQSQYIREYRNSKSEKLKDLRLNGRNGSFKISDKWRCLIEAPFKTSEQCCQKIKKKPFYQFNKQSGKTPITATMTVESRLRQKDWFKSGCNAFNNKKPISKPMSFWTEQDVLQYIKRFNIPYCSIYGDIIEENGNLKAIGEQRTGCMFCMFGCHLEKEPNKFQRMAITHPKQYDYCIRPIEENGLGLGKVLDYIGVDYKPKTKD